MPWANGWSERTTLPSWRLLQPARRAFSARRLPKILVIQPTAETVTPEGPHTHLLPDLLDGTTHDARVAIPEGRTPCLTLHIPDRDEAFDVTQPAAHR